MAVTSPAMTDEGSTPSARCHEDYIHNIVIANLSPSANSALSSCPSRPLRGALARHREGQDGMRRPRAWFVRAGSARRRRSAVGDARADVAARVVTDDHGACEAIRQVALVRIEARRLRPDRDLEDVRREVRGVEEQEAAPREYGWFQIE